MRSFRATTLTSRLGFLFALVVALTFTMVGTYLYRFLESQLEQRDDAELVGKVKNVRHLLTETASVQSIRQDPHRFRDSLSGHVGLTLVLSSVDGEVLLQEPPGTTVIPPSVVTPLDHPSDKTFLYRSTLPSGQVVRGISAWGITGTTGEKLVITLARSTSESATLLATYRSEVLLAVLFGVLLAMLLGYLFVLRTLLPVRVLARQAHSITAKRLDTRLDTRSAPKELHSLVVAFNSMLDRLHSSFQRLSQFSGDMAHDLRTPINNLMVQTQVALSQPRSLEDYQSLLVSNVEEYERLARMLDNMLFLARADEAQVRIVKQSLDTQSELHRIAEYFEGVATDAGVRIEVKAADTVVADPTLFRRAVNNLIANAIRHTRAGGVITMTAKAQQNDMAISVANPGAGISADNMPRLFDRFYRGDPARSDSASSTGLGLAIVHSIMTLHGGRVEAESVLHQATTFTLTFPLDEVSKV